MHKPAHCSKLVWKAGKSLQSAPLHFSCSLGVAESVRMIVGASCQLEASRNRVVDIAINCQQRMSDIYPPVFAIWNRPKPSGMPRNVLRRVVIIRCSKSTGRGGSKTSCWRRARSEEWRCSQCSQFERQSTCRQYDSYSRSTLETSSRWITCRGVWVSYWYLRVKRQHIVQWSHVHSDFQDFYSLVAVHGIHGNATRTWINSFGENFLLREFYDKYQRSRVLTFSYYWSLGANFPVTRKAIRAQALQLLDDLVELRKETDPVCVFLFHWRLSIFGSCRHANLVSLRKRLDRLLSSAMILEALSWRRWVATHFQPPHVPASNFIFRHYILPV